MLKTKSELARIKHVSKQAVDVFISKNGIQPAGKKGKYHTFDASQEPLAAYLNTAKRCRRPPPLAPPPEPDATPLPIETPPAPEPETAVAANTRTGRISKPLNDLLAGKLEPGRKPAAYFYDEALKIAKANQDAALLFKLAAVADKENRDEAIALQAIETEKAKEKFAIEKAERIRIENEIRRGQYMDKSVVKIIFGRNYAIDTSVLMPLGLKLADTIDAIPPGPNRRNIIQELIDQEIAGALESKRRVFMDAVKGWGGDTEND
jgi:hypothetical protein